MMLIAVIFAVFIAAPAIGVRLLIDRRQRRPKS